MGRLWIDENKIISLKCLITEILYYADKSSLHTSAFAQYVVECSKRFKLMEGVIKTAHIRNNKDRNIKAL